LKGDRITVIDATGHTWQTSDIYETSILLAVYGMLFLALNRDGFRSALIRAAPAV
jgi:hypothetical protein